MGNKGINLSDLWAIQNGVFHEDGDDLKVLKSEGMRISEEQMREIRRQRVERLKGNNHGKES